MQYDLISIGDITGDAFIRIKDARVHCDIHDGNCQICLRFGDKVPYESVTVVKAVGNSSNAAVSAARLGITTALITDVGDDENGKEYVAVLEQEGVATTFVRSHEGIPSNFHYVLQYEAERTILIKQEAYPYALPELTEEPKWIYLSSLSESSLPYHQAIAQYLTMHPNVKLTFQPGTFQMKFGTEALQDIYARTELLVCNKEEAQRILGSKEEDVTILMNALHALGPKQVIVTDGVNGAYGSDGTSKWYLPIYPDPASPVSRTGAGDATASTTTVYLMKGLPLPDALSRGLVNAMNVVQHIGAQAGLLSGEEIEHYIQEAPASFKPQSL